MKSYAANIFSNLRAVPVWLLALLTLVIIGNVISWWVIDIHPDEAYYWAWSVYPDLSYFDHPPMVAWLIWLVSKTIGINDVTLRLPAFAAWLVAAWVVYSVSSRLFGNKSYGWLALLIYCMLPVFQAASHIVTPDSPLLLFIALTYYFLFVALRENNNKVWLVAGLCVGLALLSKYNTVLIPVSAFTGMVLTVRGRQILATPWPWAAIVLSGVVFTPVVMWNYLHDWASFSYQVGHGIRPEKHFSLEFLWIYIGGQLGAALLWVMVAMMVATFRVRQRDNESNSAYIAVLASGFWVPLIFFGYAGSTTIGQVNWPAMAYLPGTILLAGLLGKYVAPGFSNLQAGPLPGRRQLLHYRILVFVLIFSCLFSVSLINMFRFPNEARKLGVAVLPTNTQISDTFGWQTLASEIRAFRSENGLPANCRTAVSTRYIWGSMIYRFRDISQFVMLSDKVDSQYAFWKSEGIFPAANTCMVIERLPHEKTGYAKNRQWPGLGEWLLVKTIVVPTSDTPRVYGFYLPASMQKRKT